MQDNNTRGRRVRHFVKPNKERGKFYVQRSYWEEVKKPDGSVERKRRTRSTGCAFDTRKEADNKCKELDDLLVLSVPENSEQITVRQFRKRMTDEKIRLGRVGKGYAKKSLGHFTYVDFLMGDKLLSEITAQHGYDLINFMENKGLARGTVSRQLREFKTLLNEAVDRQILMFNALNPIKYREAKTTVTHADVLTLQETGILFDSASKFQGGKYYAPIVVLAQGVERGVMSGLEIQHFDPKNQTLGLLQNYLEVRDADGSLIPGEVKKRPRTIQLPVEVVEAISHHIIKQSLFLQAYGIVQGPRSPLFNSLYMSTKIRQESLDSKRYIVAPDRWQHYIARVCAYAGLKVITPHKFRHMLATHSIEIKQHIKMIQEQLGHTNSQTTLNVYSHLIPSASKEYVNDLHQARLSFIPTQEPETQLRAVQ